MRIPCTLLFAMLLSGSAHADVVREGAASNGSVRQSGYLYPSEMRAEVHVRPSDRPADSARSPNQYGRTESLSPSEASRGTQAIRPGESQSSGAIRPSEHRADSAMRPGETRSHDIYNPRRPGEASAQTILRAGPATGGGIRSSARASSVRIGGASGPTSYMSLGPQGALPPGVSQQSSNWYHERTVNKTIFEAWDCGRLRYVDHGGETFRLCNGAWVRRFLWAGETSYVAIYPPEGAQLDQLPTEYRKVRVGNTTYLVVHVTFYRRSERLGRDVYEVVRPPIGAVVESLPRFALEIEPGLFQFDDVFFRRTGSKSYAVVTPPA
jgi:hypothetical protein